MSRDKDLTPRLIPGESIGGFSITRLIGRGGMAEVYEAEDKTLGRRVALKVPRSELQGNHLKERFLNEARQASRVDHQNVVTIYTAGEHEGLLYLVMQFVEGQDLSEMLQSYGSSVPWYLALKIIRIAAKGLHAVHQQGLVHRDIKPSNIMLSTGPNVYVMDFGLVRDGASTLTKTGDVLGTPPYMSPEQCRGERIDHRSDIYSLGATLYSLISGRVPFTGSTLQVVQQVGKGRSPTPIKKLVPTLPDDVAELIEKSMAVRPKNRFNDAQDLSKAIAQLLKKYKPDETESFDTIAVASSHSNIGGNQPQEIVDLVPLSSGSNTDSLPDQRRQWLVGSIVLFCAIAGLALILALQSRPANQDPARADSVDGRYSGMVLVPEGTVRLGNQESEMRAFFGQYAFNATTVDRMVSVCLESPTDPVHVDQFWIDQYEVTNAEYAKFLLENNHAAPSHWQGKRSPPGLEQHPVVHVSYSDAQAYADWAGKKLPTREQWTRAFRGDTDRLFPWGNTYEVTWINVHDRPPAGLKTTTPVTATPRDVSAFGVYNLGGNASEFLRGTFFRNDTPYRMVKGGTFDGLGCVYAVAPMFSRYDFEYSKKDTGFRCVIEDD